MREHPDLSEDKVTQGGRHGGFFLRHFLPNLVFLLSTNFLCQVGISQRGVVCALVSAQRSVNAAQQDDSGIFWDAPRECDVFVPRSS